MRSRCRSSARSPATISIPISLRPSAGSYWAPRTDSSLLRFVSLIQASRRRPSPPASSRGEREGTRACAGRGRWPRGLRPKNLVWTKHYLTLPLLRNAPTLSPAARRRGTLTGRKRCLHLVRQRRRRDRADTLVGGGRAQDQRIARMARP